MWLRPRCSARRRRRASPLHAEDSRALPRAPCGGVCPRSPRHCTRKTVARWRALLAGATAPVAPARSTRKTVARCRALLAGATAPVAPAISTRKTVARCRALLAGATGAVAPGAPAISTRKTVARWRSLLAGATAPVAPARSTRKTIAVGLRPCLAPRAFALRCFARGLRGEKLLRYVVFNYIGVGTCTPPRAPLAQSAGRRRASRAPSSPGPRPAPRWLGGPPPPPRFGSSLRSARGVVAAASAHR